MFQKIGTLIPVLTLAVVMAGCDSDDDSTSTDTGSDPVSFLGDSVTVANTFQDATLTGGEQTIYGLSDPTAVSDPAVELENYINFYDIDVSANSVTMTLVNNSDAADLILPDDRFDRYYIGFASNTVTSAELTGDGALNANATVSVLEAGFTLQTIDAFNVGLPTTVDFAQGGLLIELGSGTDLTETGVTLSVTIN